MTLDEAREHATWCTDHDDDVRDCRSAPVSVADSPRRPGEVSMRLVRTRDDERAQLLILHTGSGYPYPCVLLPVSEAAEFAGLMRALGHAKIADAVSSLMTSAGAVLTDQYGRQRWEVPS